MATPSKETKLRHRDKGAPSNSTGSESLSKNVGEPLALEGIHVRAKPDKWLSVLKNKIFFFVVCTLFL